MCNVPLIKSHILIIGTTMLLTLASCGNSMKSADEKAQNLLAEAEKMCDTGNPEQTLLLLDSLNKAYPGEIETLRKGMYLRTQATARMIDRLEAENDSLRAESQGIVDRLAGAFKTVSDKNLVESYSVCRGDGELAGTDLQARIDESGDVYLATSHSGAATGYTRLIITDGAHSATTGTARNYRFDNLEMVTFRGEECDSLCLFVAQNTAKTLKATFSGRNKATIVLSAKQKQCISQTFSFAQAVKRLKHCEGVAIYLQKQREINASQMERTRITGYR